MYLPDGTTYAEPLNEPPDVLPPSVALPFDCILILDDSYNGIVGRLRHDATPRSPGFITNEIEVLRKQRADGLKIDPNSKVTWSLNNAWAYGELDRLNGTWVADRLRTEKIGWFDTGFPVFSMLDCGGNVVIGTDNPFEYPGWLAIRYQPYQLGPQGYDHNSRPDLVTKQVLVAGKDETRILIDKGYPGGYGDAYLPKVAKEQVYVSLSRTDKQNGVKLYPPLPWETRLYGVPVTVTRFALYGSNTYVEVNGEWYLGEEMLVIGNYFEDPSRGGTMDDRRTYCDALLGMPCPAPEIGWTRQEWYIMLWQRLVRMVQR